MEDHPSTSEASYRLTGDVARLNDEIHDRYIKGAPPNLEL